MEDYWNYFRRNAKWSRRSISTVKRRKFSFRKTALFFIVLILLIILVFLGLYKFNTSSVGGNDKAISIVVEKGDNYYTIASKLKNKDLIRSEFFYKIFLKLHKPSKLVLGEYVLNKSMNVSKIIETLSDEKNVKKNIVKLTLKEGTNVRQMAKAIEEKTGIKAADFLNKINDETYINTLIEKYWFITDAVKNPQIYYDLEGYLYPDTYIFEDNQMTIDIILSTILKNTDKKLTELKPDIEKSGYSVHQILTMASLVELEAVTESDRKTVAGVFYNRLNNKWSLGSDVTTYYASKKSMTEALTGDDLNACNGYNTRCKTMQGLPVGPIANSSLTAIKAAINPEKTDYYYFVADSSKKVYFTKNATEHANIIAKLKKEGKWIG